MKKFKLIFSLSVLSLLSACSNSSKNSGMMVDRTMSPTVIETHSNWHNASEPAYRLAPKADQINYTVSVYELQRTMNTAESQAFYKALKNELDNISHLKYTDLVSSNPRVMVVTGSKNAVDENLRRLFFQKKLDGIIASNIAPQVPIISNTTKVTTYTSIPAKIKVSKVKTYIKGTTTETTAEGHVTTVYPGDIDTGIYLDITPQSSDGKLVKSLITMDIKLLDSLAVKDDMLVETPDIFHANITQSVILPSDGTLILIFNRENENKKSLFTKGYIVAISPTIYHAE